MDFRNRIGLYGAYFLGMAGIGHSPSLPSTVPIPDLRLIAAK